MAKLQRWLAAAAVLLAIAGISSWQTSRWWARSIRPVVTETAAESPLEPVRLTVEPGSTAADIGAELARRDLIRSAEAWRLYARWLRWREETGGFQAGTYEISPTASLPDVARQIWSGEVVQQRFTIPEGWSIEKMARYFEEEGFFSAEAFVAAAETIPYDRHPWLPEELPHLEGFLFPNTYQLPEAGVTPEAAVDIMLEEFKQSALPVYDRGANPLSLSLKEWVTLASVVEKEAVVAEERPLIAGVFSERLRQGMKLEADPTVEYGLGIEQTPERPLTFAEVETPSPYNTYLNPGLPPTPIASPGLASLKATIDPSETDYLFFVARYDGTHIFSRTLAEHEAAIDKVRAQFE